MIVEFDAREVRAFVRLTEAEARRLGERLPVITRHYGQLLQTQVQANAMGRPGPRMITGDYVRSMTLRLGGDGHTSSSATVGTNKAQGRRLELGFIGVDSKGRHYPSQIRRVKANATSVLAGTHSEIGYPYPHFAPALRKIGPEYEQALLAAVTPR